jgi:hypothetical protein
MKELLWFVILSEDTPDNMPLTFFLISFFAAIKAMFSPSKLIDPTLNKKSSMILVFLKTKSENDNGPEKKEHA